MPAEDGFVERTSASAPRQTWPAAVHGQWNVRGTADRRSQRIGRARRGFRKDGRSRRLSGRFRQSQRGVTLRIQIGDKVRALLLIGQAGESHACAGHAILRLGKEDIEFTGNPGCGLHAVFFHLVRMPEASRLGHWTADDAPEIWADASLLAPLDRMADHALADSAFALR